MDTVRPCGFHHHENDCVVCAVYERDMADIGDAHEAELAEGWAELALVRCVEVM